MCCTVAAYVVVMCLSLCVCHYVCLSLCVRGGVYIAVRLFVCVAVYVAVCVKITLHAKAVCLCVCVFYLSQSNITDICGANLLEGKERQSARRGTLASARMSGALTDCHVSKAAFFANSFAKHLLTQPKKQTSWLVSVLV